MLFLGFDWGVMLKKKVFISIKTLGVCVKCVRVCVHAWGGGGGGGGGGGDKKIKKK